MGGKEVFSFRGFFFEKVKFLYCCNISLCIICEPLSLCISLFLCMFCINKMVVKKPNTIMRSYFQPICSDSSTTHQATKREKCMTGSNNIKVAACISGCYIISSLQTNKNVKHNSPVRFYKKLLNFTKLL